MSTKGTFTPADDESSDEENVCPECSGSRVMNRCETFCDNCGLVLDESLIDHNAEWRDFGGTEETSRTRASGTTSKNRHDDGMGGQYAEGEYRYHVRGKVQTLKEGLGEVHRVANGLGLPTHVNEDAATLFHEASSTDLLPGHNIDVVASACVYIAACRSSVPHTYEEVANASYEDMTRDDVKTGHWYLQGNLDSLNEVLLRPAPCDYVMRFLVSLYGSSGGFVGETMTLIDDIRRTTLALLDEAETVTAFQNRATTTQVAGAIYEATNRLDVSTSQTEVGDVASVSRQQVGCAARDLRPLSI